MNKGYFLAFVGIIGTAIEKMFGGWSDTMTTLILFMSIDCISGLIIGMLNKSLKTESGGLNSKVSFKGLCKKGMIVLIIIIGYRLDLVLNINFLKDTIIIAFIENETVSIIENAGLLGVPIPIVLRKVIDVLNKRNEEVKDFENTKDFGK